jgi:hypothetical protein
MNRGVKVKVPNPYDDTYGWKVKPNYMTNLNEDNWEGIIKEQIKDIIRHGKQWNPMAGPARHFEKKLGPIKTSRG